MKKVLLLLLCVVIFVIKALGQIDNNPLKVQPIITHSPEASSLGRYGEVEVGEFTGAPNIAIQLHIVKSGKIEFPINLYYNATGIKVNEEATWVGLGWDLSAVAGITYITAGGNDQLVNIVEPWSDWQKLISFISPIQAGPTSGFEDIPGSIDCANIIPGSSTETPGNVVRSAIAGRGDRDMYSVNCPGFSFKFYIHPGTNKPKVYGDKNNFKIEQVGNMGFTITDEKGVKYSFLEKEGVSILNPISDWLLTEIRRPDGDWLKFKYENFGLMKVAPTLAEQRIVLGGGIAAMTAVSSPRNVDSPWLRNLYLTEIESKTEI